MKEELKRLKALSALPDYVFAAWMAVTGYPVQQVIQKKKAIAKLAAIRRNSTIALAVSAALEIVLMLLARPAYATVGLLALGGSVLLCAFSFALKGITRPPSHEEELDYYKFDIVVRRVAIGLGYSSLQPWWIDYRSKQSLEDIIGKRGTGLAKCVLLSKKDDLEVEDLLDKLVEGCHDGLGIGPDETEFFSKARLEIAASAAS